jgi:hypothetical protein
MPCIAALSATYRVKAENYSAGFIGSMLRKEQNKDTLRHHIEISHPASYLVHLFASSLFYI